MEISRPQAHRFAGFCRRTVNPMANSEVDGNRPKRQKTGGRQKGTPNKVSGALRDAILSAAKNAGGEDGMIGYLEQQAKMNPGPFMSLLGKVLPTQVTGEDDGPIKVSVVRFTGL